jgi:hypothetical protein
MKNKKGAGRCQRIYDKCTMFCERSANPLFQVMEISHLFSKQMSIYFNAVRDEPYMLGEFTFLFTLC